MEEFDDNARYQNHPDKASSIKWLSLHDGSVPAAKLKQASKEEPGKEIKTFFLVKSRTYLFIDPRSFRYTRVCVYRQRPSQLW